MFERLKAAFAKFGKKVEEESIPKEKKPKKEPKQKRETKQVAEKGGFWTFKKKEEKAEEAKKGFLERITETKISEDKFDHLFYDFENELLQNNVAYSIVEGIKQELKSIIIDKPIKRKDAATIVQTKLKDLLIKILTSPQQIDLLAEAKKHKPLVLLLTGVNGTGKTTSLAKLAKFFQNNKLSCIFAAGDTFRAASIEQLQEHADRLGIKVVKHKYGADPAAVAFDAVESAKAKGIDVVLIDTAGRQHANEDLMAELAKIKRVAKPNVTILTIDALTGNDAVEQAEFFDEKIGIDGTILSKTDADEKGGAIISVGYITKKPILFIGTGQSYMNLEKFDADKILNKLF